MLTTVVTKQAFKNSNSCTQFAVSQYVFICAPFKFICLPLRAYYEDNIPNELGINIPHGMYEIWKGNQIKLSFIFRRTALDQKLKSKNQEQSFKLIIWVEYFLNVWLHKRLMNSCGK